MSSVSSARPPVVVVIESEATCARTRLSELSAVRVSDAAAAAAAAATASNDDDDYTTTRAL